MATKQLLETLTQWSRGNAKEEEVSDVYVRLGYEFNIACRAFNSINVDTSDLGPVPDLLRNILEDTLSQPASPQALDNFLPRIRDIIINLLQGLKKKQSRLRNRGSLRDEPSGRRLEQPERHTSVGSTTSGAVTTTSSQDNISAQILQDNADGRRGSSSVVNPPNTQQEVTPGPGLARGTVRKSVRREPQNSIPFSGSSSTVASTTAQQLPVLSPSTADSSLNSSGLLHPPLPPPPPPPKQDALTALQRGGDLERRASRRFSAYQIQKHLGAPSNGVVIPPPQNSPIPNRGRDGREAQESMRAVTSRTSSIRERPRPSRYQSSPDRGGAVGQPQTITEEQEPPTLRTFSTPVLEPPDEPRIDDSPLAKTPDAYLGTSNSYIQPSDIHSPVATTTPFPATKEPQHGLGIATDREATPKPPDHRPPSRVIATPEPRGASELDSSPPSSKDLTLFLQYKTRVKKFVLTGGYEELTMARLQLAFIEKFAWSSQDGGADLPEIYIQDPVSGVRHELEDLSEVKDRTVLVLNFEALEEVKKHFDEEIDSLKGVLNSVKHSIDGQNTMIQRFSDKQLEASKEMARLSAAPTPRITRAVPILTDKTTSPPMNEAHVIEVQNLKRDIAVLRQTYSSMSSDFAAGLSSIKAKAAAVNEAATAAVEPSWKGNEGRLRIESGKARLGSEMEAVISRFDEVQDNIDELRKDVVTRGVRPRPRDLEVVSADIAAAIKDVLRMKDFVKQEKPVWTKIWAQELNTVMVEQQELSTQESVLADLIEDSEGVKEIYALIEETMKQQAAEGKTGPRTVSKTLEIDPATDPNQAKEGVLDEVRALQPNHENRLEAIERAEKARQRDLVHRQANEFQREVEKFVADGHLKKTGGMDEVERVRKVKDAQALRENWATQQAQEVERDKKRAEKAAAKAAAKAAQGSPPAAPPPSHKSESVYGEHDLEDGTNNHAGPETSQEDETPFFTATTSTPAESENASGGDRPGLFSAAAYAFPASTKVDTHHAEPLNSSQPPALPPLTLSPGMDG